jgi:hypothetical protein
LTKYPLEIRAEALNEARSIVGQFAEKVRKLPLKKTVFCGETASNFRPKIQDNGAGGTPGKSKHVLKGCVEFIVI